MSASFGDGRRPVRPGQEGRHDIVLSPPPDLTRPRRSLPPGFPVVRFVFGVTTLGISVALMIALAGAFGRSPGVVSGAHRAAAFRAAPVCPTNAMTDTCRATADAYVVETDYQSGGATTYGVELYGSDFNDQWVYVDNPTPAFLAATAKHDVVSVGYWGCTAATGELGCEVQIAAVTAGGTTAYADPVATHLYTTLNPGERSADLYVPEGARPAMLNGLAIFELIAWALFCSAGVSRAYLALGVRRRNWPLLIRLLRWAAYSSSLLLAVGGTVLLGFNVVAAGIPLLILAYGIIIYTVVVPLLVPLGPRHPPGRLIG